MTTADEPTLHMIGHAHIDPVWLWQWPEGCQEALATFRSALDRMREDDEFTFMASTAALYDWVRLVDPEMFAELRERVAEGRWEVVGGWWVEPDCNIPTGESFVRQALVGQRWFHQHLGVTATIGFNPDSFGHNAMLPQILSRSGLEAYSFMRPSDHELGLPGRTFWWESDDGSRILSFRIPFEYLTWGREFDAHVKRCAAELRPPHRHMMCYYGVGNHGGGPTRANIARIGDLQSDGLEGPDAPTVVMSTPSQFFAAVRDQGLDLPVVHGELQSHARGCYAAHTRVKAWNRRAEHRLLDAERLVAVAARTVDVHVEADFQRAWRNVLFNQFHDILPGTSIASAYVDTRDELGEATAIANRAASHALQAMSHRVAIELIDDTMPIVVFNPHSWDVTAPVEMEVGRLPEHPVVQMDDGQVLPVQLVQSEATVSGGRQRIVFRPTVPPVGHVLARIVAGTPSAISTADSAADLAPGSSAETGNESDEVDDAVAGATLSLGADHDWAGTDVSDELILDNGRVRARFTARDGFAGLYDAAHDLELLASPARVEMIADTTDTWSHGLHRFDGDTSVLDVRGVRLVEDGPVRRCVRVEYGHGNSRLDLDVRVYAGSSVVEVAGLVDWHDPHHVLKLRLPLDLRMPRANFEIPFGRIERATDGTEVPGQRWVDMSGVDRGTNLVRGLTVSNDGKHSFDADAEVLGITLVRSPIHAHHDPKVPGADTRYHHQGMGRHAFRLWLSPHAGTWADAGAARLAMETNQPLTGVVESVHDGTLPARGSFLSIDHDNVLVSALKPAEDGHGLVIRCYEASGRAVSTTIRLHGLQRRIAADFGPHEITTFLVPDDPDQPVAEVNLLEWPDS